MSTIKLTTEYKIKLFAGLFQGLRNVYGTYNPETGKYWQIKQKVTKKTIYEHLKGIRPYGFYPLTGNRTRVGVADFDSTDPEAPLQFISRAKHYEIDAYLEQSKSKGFHVWMFFRKEGVPAKKVRIFMKNILDEIESSDTEIFPKQDMLDKSGYYGNFINAPLFGKFIPEEKTVFIRPDASIEPFLNQWTLLESIRRIKESNLDSIIEINNLDDSHNNNQNRNYNPCLTQINRFSLPICMRKILHQGVTFDQRVACFRLAIQLKRVGIPQEGTVALLLHWRNKNRPIENKRIITPAEIEEQVLWTYSNNYTGFGCQEPVIRFFCDAKCPIAMRNRR